ncbi:MFS transporter [Palaeococcus ferrophilus]|uniref:MFS transporter n=1 Tax=Palaeococcus ferrophilus TaxID=83868 RepID=UPI00064F848C|nr:MFS transporter [Palaeococcus ferrophilus]
MARKNTPHLHAMKVSGLHGGRAKNRWFYSFIPFKVATGGSSVVIPLYVLALGGSGADVGIANAVSGFASMVGSVFWGNLSDRLLRRRVFITLGFASVSAFLALFAITGSLTEFIVMNGIYAFFLATTTSIPVVLVLRSFRKREWNDGLGRFNEVGGWGWLLGLVIGLFMSAFLDIRAMFIVFAIINLPAAFLLARSVREAPVYVNRDSIKIKGHSAVQRIRQLPSGILHLPSTPDTLRSFYVASAMFWFSSGLFFSQAPVFLTLNGMEREAIYTMSIGNALVSTLLYRRVGNMLNGRDPYTVLRWGLITRGLGVATMLGGTLVAPLAYVMAGVSWPLISLAGTSIVSELAPGKEKGREMGRYNFVNFSALIAGNLGSGFIVNGVGFQGEWILAAFMALSGLLPVMGSTIKNVERRGSVLRT